jgi:hypothetical protein
MRTFVRRLVDGVFRFGSIASQRKETPHAGGERGGAGADRKTRVLFVAWFLNPARHWLGEFLPDEQFECSYVGGDEPVDVTEKRTGARKWLLYFRLALEARRHLAEHPQDLIVTAFPQVGFAVSVINALTGVGTPHVVWYFNCGHEYRGLRRLLSRIAFRTVSRCVVYTRHERAAYARVFALRPERFHFTYLSGAELDGAEYRGARARFGLAPRYIAALGSSGRDYATFFAATRALPIQSVVVTHPYSLEGVDVPPNAKVLTSIPQSEYLRIIREAELVVIPVNNVETASGQMTLIQAMSLGVPVVATRCIGTEDYIVDGVNGQFVRMGDVEELRRVLLSLLEDPARREAMAERALRFAADHFTDRAAARVLAGIAADVCNRPDLGAGPADVALGSKSQRLEAPP